MAVHLSDKKCVACEGGVPPFDESQIRSYLPELKPGWEVIQGKKIKKEFTFRDFKDAMDFVNKVADIAESEGHHPDLHIFYNKVVMELTTHAIHGLSENDFIIAAKVEKLIS